MASNDFVTKLSEDKTPTEENPEKWGTARFASCFTEYMSGFPEKWGTVEPRFLAELLTRVSPDFVRVNPAFPKYVPKTEHAHASGTSLDIISQPMGPLKATIFGTAGSPEEKKKAKAELKKHEEMLEDLLLETIQMMTLENAWDYNSERAFSFGLQLIAYLCLMRNTKTGAFKIAYSNKRYSFEFLLLFHSEKYGVGSYIPKLGKIMDEFRDLWVGHAKKIEWQMLCQVVRAAGDKGLTFCSANHWGSDILDLDAPSQELVKSILAEAVTCPPYKAASETCEYVNRELRARLPEKYTEKDLHNVWDKMCAPVLAKMREANVLTIIDDVKNPYIFPLNKDGAVWDPKEKNTRLSHLTTSDFLHGREELFDIVKIDMPTCIYGTRTGEETEGHRVCADGHVYSNKKGYNTEGKIKEIVGRELQHTIGGPSRVPSLEETRAACEDELKKRCKKAVKLGKSYVNEGSATPSSLVRINGLLTALEFGAIQGAETFEFKGHPSCFFSETLEKIAKMNGCPLESPAKREADEGWEELSLDDVKAMDPELLALIEQMIVKEDEARQDRNNMQKAKEASEASSEASRTAARFVKRKFDEISQRP